MATIGHGGSLWEARRRFPQARDPWIDLSTGINPEPYPLPHLPIEAFTRLPEPEEVWTLQTAAALAYGVDDPAKVVAAPGTQILISILPRLFPQPTVRVLGPTYAEHARSWAMAGAKVAEVGSIGELAGSGAAVLCNPNNPDGSRVHRADLLALADRTGLLVVDEAFADLEADGISLAPALARAGVIVLRSFGKSYGLAGLRLGFALAAPAVAAVIQDALGPWAVSGPALQIGTAALRDTAWRQRATERLSADVERLDAWLRDAGCAVIGGTRLFRLADVSAAPDLFERLGAAGIFARRFAERPQHLRFGIPRHDQWSRLESVLAP